MDTTCRHDGALRPDIGFEHRANSLLKPAERRPSLAEEQVAGPTAAIVRGTESWNRTAEFRLVLQQLHPVLLQLAIRRNVSVAMPWGHLISRAR
jgi:hypothetical protein